jgi:hypothetical protein
MMIQRTKEVYVSMSCLYSLELEIKFFTGGFWNFYGRAAEVDGALLVPSIVYEYAKLANNRGAKSLPREEVYTGPCTPSSYSHRKKLFPCIRYPINLQNNFQPFPRVRLE